ncbi:hypothetical protein EYF80_029986 [Liparis tanakae]|uniref:Uncharacterized protein n=1 Tax=Liparis tanakae TaxID=230148 RepID=A0A4Z2H2J4_9TELE|nr:hypothetical protein EYF80_029986 [Liparis tanakae]
MAHRSNQLVVQDDLFLPARLQTDSWAPVDQGRSGGEVRHGPGHSQPGTSRDQTGTDSQPRGPPGDNRFRGMRPSGVCLRAHLSPDSIGKRKLQQSINGRPLEEHGRNDDCLSSSHDTHRELHEEPGSRFSGSCRVLLGAKAAGRGMRRSGSTSPDTTGWHVAVTPETRAS